MMAMIPKLNRRHECHYSTSDDGWLTESLTWEHPMDMDTLLRTKAENGPNHDKGWQSAQSR